MCRPKTILKIGLGLAVVLGGVFLLFPQFRPVIIGLAPFALLALCPLGMIFGMSAMSGNHKTGTANESALKILADRYAKGEITKEEFESKKNNLSSCC